MVNPLSLCTLTAVLFLPLSATAQTTTSDSESLPFSLSESIVSSTSTPTLGSSSSEKPPAPTANSTVGNNQQLFLWPPQAGLKQCERVSFAFTKPAVPLTCGIYVTNTSTYLEQVILSPTYNTLTSGTFSWLVDMPIGLSVNVQVFVTLNGQIQQYTLPSMVVLEGSDNSCFGRNIGQNTQSIISYASSLNQSYIYTAPSSSSTGRSSGSKGGGISGGAIAGIVIGVLAAFILSLLLIFYFRRKIRRRLQSENGQAFSNHPNQQQVQSNPSLSSPLPVGTTYAQNYAQSVMSSRSNNNHHNGPISRQSNPPGTIAEVMSTTPPPQSASPIKSERNPGGVGGGNGGGTRGLADPNSFVSRSNSGRAL